MSRPSIHEYFLQIANVVSSRATCQDAKVGCVLVNVNNQILATGYNGTLPGEPECTDGTTCKLTRSNQHGTTQVCPTIHAEANALHQYRTLHGKPILPMGTTAYVTRFPCLPCLLQLIQASVTTIVYSELNSWSTMLRQQYIHQVGFVYYPLQSEARLQLGNPAITIEEAQNFTQTFQQLYTEDH